MALVAELPEEHESSALLAAKRRDLVDEMCASEDRLKEELSRLSEIKQLESNEVGQLVSWSPLQPSAAGKLPGFAPREIFAIGASTTPQANVRTSVCTWHLHAAKIQSPHVCNMLAVPSR